MKKVLFTHSYFYKFDEKQWNTRRFYPPLGTITAASFVRQNGFTVKLFDTNLAHDPTEIVPVIREFKPDYLVVYDDGFNYLTKMCLTLMRDAAYALIRIGGQSGCQVIVSSSDSTDHFEEYLNKGARAILLGEGELSLLDVLNALDDKTPIVGIKGIAFRDNEGKIQNNGRRAVIEDLNMLPQAAWDLVDMDKYKKIWIRHHSFFSLNLATTRGCPYSCNWCAKPIYGRKYNVRSPENVVNEIEYLVKSYTVDHFWICDDIFGLKPGWIQEFRDIVKQRNLVFRFIMQSRVDVMLRDNTIGALADAGLETVWVGAESGSQKVLDAMEKDIRVEQIARAREKLKKHGVRVGFFLQFGYPGETLEDIYLTEKMLFDLMPDDMGISVSYPLPGTKFHEKVKADLKNKSNWTDSDDLALMFNNVYPPKFYKMLHRYLHQKFRRKQGLEQIIRFVFQPSKNSRGILRTLAATMYHIPATVFFKFRMKQSLKAR